MNLLFVLRVINKYFRETMSSVTCNVLVFDCLDP